MQTHLLNKIQHVHKKVMWFCINRSCDNKNGCDGINEIVHCAKDANTYGKEISVSVYYKMLTLGVI